MTENKQTSHLLADLAEPINRYIHDPIGAGLVKWLKNTPVTANQVTYVSIIFGLASAYAFSHGTVLSIIHAGFFLEITLILDCADGQLARAKGSASDWGRLLDGIAGYIAYIAVVIGIMIGYGGYYGTLGAIAVVTILKAISYDYCKQSMTRMVQEGVDGNLLEIQKIRKKLEENPGLILKVYLAYLLGQRAMLGGRNRGEEISRPLNPDERQRYCDETRFVRSLWKWNGQDLPLFLIAVLAICGVLEASLVPMAWFLGAQHLLTLTAHYFFMKR